MSDFVSIAVLAGIVSSLSGGGATEQPIRIVVEAQGATDVVRVVAQGDSRCTATYELVVAAKGNRSVSRGTATLSGEGAVTLATVKVSHAARAATTASLKVTPCGKAPYEQVWSSADSRART